MSYKSGKYNINYKHGGTKLHPVEYSAWKTMKSRCYCGTNKRYDQYGGRGITVCDEWIDDFTQFFKDMGPRPDHKSSLDRINNDQGYSAANCRWSDPVQQSNNRTSCRNYEYNGETKNISQWSSITGINDDTLIHRIDVQGMSITEAIETPVPNRKGTKYTHNGITNTLAGWSRRLGINRHTLGNRIKRGRSFEQAINMNKGEK